MVTDEMIDGWCEALDRDEWPEGWKRRNGHSLDKGPGGHEAGDCERGEEARDFDQQLRPRTARRGPTRRIEASENLRTAVRGRRDVVGPFHQPLPHLFETAKRPKVPHWRYHPTEVPGELEHSKRRRDVSTEQTWIRRWRRGAGTLIGGSEATGLRVLRGGSRSSRSRNLRLTRQASRSQGREKGLCRRCGVFPSALPLRKSAFYVRAVTQTAPFRRTATAECAFP